MPKSTRTLIFPQIDLGIDFVYLFSFSLTLSTSDVETKPDMSHNSYSDANSFTQRSYIDGPFCRHCNRATMISKAWTPENPGRRFYKCEVHGFVSWADIEKPGGWQKVSLLEARDHINRLKEEINELRRGNQQSVDAGAVDLNRSSELLKKHEEEKKKLQNEAMVSKEREQLLRQFIVLSWGGFIVVTAMILKMMKN